MSGNTGSATKLKTAVSVVVLYDDAAEQEAAVKFCDDLVQRFWVECDFDLNWWRLSLLDDALQREEAATKASQADFIIVATPPESDWPESVVDWVEGWVNLRGEREGVMVGLLDPGHGAKTAKYLYLRDAAHRAGMDYLTHMPLSFTCATPESIDTFSQRAEQVTSVLDEILHREPSPRRLLV